MTLHFERAQQSATNISCGTRKQYATVLIHENMLNFCAFTVSLSLIAIILVLRNC
jgi:hypothetical protein